MKLEPVTIYELRVNRRLLAIGLSVHDVQKHFAERTLDRAEVTSYLVQAGAVDGRLCDWNSGALPRQLKIHWDCPSCNMQHWTDWTEDFPRRTLQECMCHCVKHWLLSYDPATH